MRLLLIPDRPDSRRLNHAPAADARQTAAHLGRAAAFHDLDGMASSPALTAGGIPAGANAEPLAATHCPEIAAAEGLIFVRPNGWSQSPALRKGRLEPVLRPGVAYRFLPGDAGQGVPDPPRTTHGLIADSTPARHAAWLEDARAGTAAAFGPAAGA